jgi:(5-formylfuran-3-yl)methyl phosphate synthase
MRLMISVVSAQEAREAMEGGAEILDVKNPAEGSLGAQPPRVIRDIRSLASGSVELSAAIGDMPNLPGTAALAALGAATCGADYVKIGLHGPRTGPQALALLRDVRQAVLGFKTAVIAAAYADFERAGTINPRDLPALAASAGVGGCLLDTAIKDGQSLFAFMDPRTLRFLVEQAHAAGLIIGLAGTLREEDLGRVRDTGADIVGLRSAVCRNHSRNEPLDASRVRQLRRILVPVV